jgi:hypothetical protein
VVFKRIVVLHEAIDKWYFAIQRGLKQCDGVRRVRGRI